MKEKQFAIVGSNKYDDLLRMRILEVFKYAEYVFGFASHILSFKAIQPIGKTDIYNVLAVVVYKFKSKIYESKKNVSNANNVVE